MRRPFWILLPLLAALLAPTGAWEASVSQNIPITITPANSAFYVATDGSDNNSGTLSAPFATLGKCQTAMQDSTTKTCYIRAGTYTLPSTGLVLTSSDNNETWSYYPPDGVSTPILSGSSLSGSTFAINSTATGISFVGLKFIDNSYIIAFSQGNNSSWINNFFEGSGTLRWYGMDIFGNGNLIKGNTFQNFSTNNGGGSGIFLNSTGFTNSIIENNTFQCLGDFGINGLSGGASGNVFANNQVLNIGNNGGGTAPNCTTVVNDSGTGIEVSGSGPNLYVGNTITGAQGYALVGGGTTGSTTMPALISDNTMNTTSDPVILINSASNSVVRRNTITSNGSIGMNLGEEHDSGPGCAAPGRPGYSNNLLVTNNNITAQYEPIYVSVSQNSTIRGNTGNIGVISVSGISPHYQAGITFPNWAADVGCTPVEESSGNIVGENSFTSANNDGGFGAANAQYGIYFETNQHSNTIEYNVIYPYGSPGTAAIQNNSGGSQTLTGNQATSSTTPLNGAPPVANAGPSQTLQSGASVNLNGSATHNMVGSNTISYSWSQIFGSPTVTIINPTSSISSFTAPSVSQVTILGFQLTATTVNGSTSDQVYIAVGPF
jgi:hypothetical protein